MKARLPDDWQEPQSKQPSLCDSYVHTCSYLISVVLNVLLNVRTLARVLIMGVHDRAITASFDIASEVR